MIDMISIEQCVHTVVGITYNISELQDLYEELKSFRRTRPLILENKSIANKVETDPDKAVQSQIMKHHKAADANRPGYDVGQHPIVQQLIKQFKIKINPDLVDINCFRPGFEFFPHTDQVMCTIMWPIIPTSGGAPIDFYFKEGLVPQPATEYKSMLTKKDKVAEHHYSTSHPAIINQRQIHGVSKLDHERVYLRFKIYDYSFEDLVKLDNLGQLV
jgi:hypothetical protein